MEIQPIMAALGGNGKPLSDEEKRAAELEIIDAKRPPIDRLTAERIRAGHPDLPPRSRLCWGNGCTEDTLCDPCMSERKYLALFEQRQQHGKPLHPSERARYVHAADSLAALPRLTDLGNAEWLVKQHGQDLRYYWPWKTWLVWDGVRWQLDETGEAERRAKDAIMRLYDEAKRLPVPERENLLAHALATEKRADRIGAMIGLARSERGIPILPAQLDTDSFLLNVRNGTLDLRTGQLRAHDRRDHITKLAPVKYDPDASCPLWERFLDRIMDGNRDLIDYLRRVVGYALTGDVSEQCLWFLHGLGMNGKSVFLLTVLKMLGDYGMQAVSELLLVKSRESHPTERADLHGRRFAATVETDEGKRIAEALMKQLTGGDPIRARKCFKDFFEFMPTHKIFLAANHKPTIRGTDLAIWRRIKLIPFTVTIPEEERDKKLPDKLKGELPGILAWAVRGCLEWQQQGLGEPDEVLQATAEYQADEDSVAGFLRECCVQLRDAKAKSSELLSAYTNWSDDKAMTPKMFARRLESKGFIKSKGGDGCMWWAGIGLPEEKYGG